MEIVDFAQSARAALAVQRAEKGPPGGEPKGPHRQPAQFGGGRGHRPHRLPRGAAPGGVLPHRAGQKPKAHFRRHVELGRELQGAKQLIKECRSTIHSDGLRHFFKINHFIFFNHMLFSNFV